MKSKVMHALLLLLLSVASPLALAELVNVNRADADVMVQNFSGIGPKKAAAIVAYRKLNGTFESIDDLLAVKGIGPKLLDKNRSEMSLKKGLEKATAKPQKVAATKAKSSAKKETKKE